MGNLGERGGAEEDVGRPRVGDMRGKGNKEGGKVWDTKSLRVLVFVWYKVVRVKATRTPPATASYCGGVGATVGAQPRRGVANSRPLRRARRFRGQGGPWVSCCYVLVCLCLTEGLS